MSAMGGERGGGVERNKNNNGLKHPKLGEKHKLLDWRSSQTPNKVLPTKFMGRHITIKLENYKGKSCKQTEKTVHYLCGESGLMIWTTIDFSSEKMYEEGSGTTFLSAKMEKTVNLESAI